MIRLCLLVILFSLWSRSTGSLCSLTIYRDGGCSLYHYATSDTVAGFPFILTKGSWRPIKWFWRMLRSGKKVTYVVTGVKTIHHVPEGYSVIGGIRSG